MKTLAQLQAENLRLRAENRTLRRALDIAERLSDLAALSAAALPAGLEALEIGAELPAGLYYRLD